MTKKTDLQTKTNKEINRLKHEVMMSSQVTTEQGKQLDEKERDYNKLSKQVKTCKEKLKEKENIIKQLKETSDKSSEVEEIPQKDDIEVVEESLLMNNPSSGHVCNACNKSFR